MLNEEMGGGEEGGERGMKREVVRGNDYERDGE